MTIIKIAPEWNNAHCSLTDVDYILWGWAELPAEFEADWEQHKPFVNIEVDDDGTIISMTAAEEIVADEPEPEETPTDDELLVSAIMEGLNYD